MNNRHQDNPHSGGSFDDFLANQVGCGEFTNRTNNVNDALHTVQHILRLRNLNPI